MALRIYFPKEYEWTELHLLGWITITSIGDENIYFVLHKDGSQGFAKYQS